VYSNARKSLDCTYVHTRGENYQFQINYIYTYIRVCVFAFVFVCLGVWCVHVRASLSHTMALSGFSHLFSVSVGSLGGRERRRCETGGESEEMLARMDEMINRMQSRIQDKIEVQVGQFVRLMSASMCTTKECSFPYNSRKTTVHM